MGEKNIVYILFSDKHDKTHTWRFLWSRRNLCQSVIANSSRLKHWQKKNRTKSLSIVCSQTFSFVTTYFSLSVRVMWACDLAKSRQNRGSVDGLVYLLWKSFLLYAFLMNRSDQRAGKQHLLHGVSRPESVTKLLAAMATTFKMPYVINLRSFLT